jgi:3-oxoacyl-[acyl-carrier protein] reductase
MTDTDAATNEAPLLGRTALVTGAGRNTGRAIALRLAREGADVAVNVRRDTSAGELVAQDIRAMGRRAAVIAADIGQPEQARAMVRTAAASLGPVSVVVLCASTRSASTFRELDAAEWAETLNVTLNGAFHSLQEATEGMIAQGFGRVVAISGDGPHQGMRGHSHVGAAKLGLEGLIRAIAVELGEFGITANTVSPGVVDTVRSPRTPVHAERLQREIDKVLAASPIGRLVDMEEVAEAVAFLCRPTSSGINGQNLHVNGGAYLGY